MTMIITVLALAADVAVLDSSERSGLIIHPVIGIDSPCRVTGYRITDGWKETWTTLRLVVWQPILGARTGLRSL